MTTTSEKVEAFVQKNETNIKPERSLMQVKFTVDLIRLIGSFQIDNDLKNLMEVTRFFYFSCQGDMRYRKKVKEELLPHIFAFTVNEGERDGIDKFFDSVDSVKHPHMVLIKTRFREGYDSKKFREFVCFREWRGVSAIQAAALCGDEGILIKLLAYVVKENQYRLQALQQLEEVKLRILKQDIILNAVTAIKEIEFGENNDIKADAKLRLKEIQKSEEFQKQMKEFINEMEELHRRITDQTMRIQKRATAPAPSHRNAPKQKSEAGEKVAVEKTPIKYADDAEFLEPVSKLLKAYIYYYIQYTQLSSQGVGDKINQLWGYVGECHRRLMHYFKQEFFSDKPFSIDPLPTFKTSPPRGSCQYWNHDALDLDGLGIGTLLGLYKGWGLAPGWGSAQSGVWFVCDMTVVAHLYTLRITGLENIIEQLKRPEITYALVSAVNGSRLTF